MSDSPPYAAHVQLLIDQAQCLLDHAKVRSGNQWSQVLTALDRLETVIDQVREELTPAERDETVARLKLYRSNTGEGWTAAWFVDLDDGTNLNPRTGAVEGPSGGLVGHHETWRSAWGAALDRLEDHLHVT
jgi:hypothetical protein